MGEPRLGGSNFSMQLLGPASPFKKKLLLLLSHYQTLLYFIGRVQEPRESLPLSLTFQVLCEPQSYCPMYHQDHKEELLKCRSQSKAWEGERQLQEQIALLVKDVSPR